MNYPHNNKSNKILLIFIISLFLVSTLSAQSIISKEQSTFKTSFPVVITEKGNYQIDDMAQIYGMNFQSYERVRLSVKYFNNSLRQEIPLNSFDVYADKRGYISAEWKVFDVDQTDTTYIVTATGTKTGITTKTDFSTLAPAATSVNLSQCANSNAVPQNLDCPSSGPAGWVSGLVGSSKARYFEGDSIAYRNVMDDLVVGNNYKWTVQYDTSKGGINAIDYMTTYNRSITNANPCADGADPSGHCTLGAVTSTFAIPGDPIVAQGRDQTNGTSDDITQIPGDITAWGATITGVSVPVYSGTYPGGDSTATVEITFTADSPKAVIAWGGHISTRNDWGQAFGSVNITGAPYHFNNGGLMNLTASTVCCGGSQDLQLQNAVVIMNATIRIIKHATPPSPQQFDFSTIGLTPANFSLVDNSSTDDPIQVFDNITTFNLKTITETNMGAYDLVSIVCTVDVGTGGTPAPVRNGNSIEIDIKSGDVVTCTFNNDFVTAANVSISGRVHDSNGNGLGNALVTISSIDGSPSTVRTNHFGYYRFENLEAGDNYLLSVRHKNYEFTSQLLSAGSEVTNFDFHPNQ